MRALVTGGSRGIGRATVAELAKMGCEVVFTYQKNQAAALELQTQLAQQDRRTVGVQLDLAESDTIQSKIEPFMGEHGFDIVVHNAAIVADTPFYFMDHSQWQDVIQVSLNSFYFLNKMCLPAMIQRRFGRIITIASISGEAGNRGQVNYSAAKGAIIAATKALAREVAIKGVLVNCVSPGLIETDMTKDLAMPAEQLRQMVPQGRYGTAQEVANVIGFLASDKASYINGAVLRVNGGLYT